MGNQEQTAFFVVIVFLALGCGVTMAAATEVPLSADCVDHHHQHRRFVCPYPMIARPRLVTLKTIIKSAAIIPAKLLALPYGMWLELRSMPVILRRLFLSTLFSWLVSWQSESTFYCCGH